MYLDNIQFNVPKWFHHVPHLAPKYPLEFKKKNTNRKKYSLTPVLSRAAQGVKLPILSKKCIFQAENVIFLKSSFYTKFISDPKYSFSVGQKTFFVVQSKVSIFHRIQPMHIASPDIPIQLSAGAGVR